MIAMDQPYQWYVDEGGGYYFFQAQKKATRDDMVEMWKTVDKYPIISIEDGMVTTGKAGRC